MKNKVDLLMTEYAESTKGDKKRDLSKTRRWHFDEKITFLQRKRMVISISLVLVLSLIVVAIIPFVASDVSSDELPPVIQPNLNLGSRADLNGLVDIPPSGDNRDIIFDRPSTIEEFYSYNVYLTLPYINGDDFIGGIFSLMTDSKQRISGYCMTFSSVNEFTIYDGYVSKQAGELLTYGNYYVLTQQYTAIIPFEGVDYYYCLEDNFDYDLKKYLFGYQADDGFYTVFVRSMTEFTPEELLNILYGESSPYKRT